MFKYTELDKHAQAVARKGLMDDSLFFGWEPSIKTSNEAHLDLLAHDEENRFDEDGILISSGGCYAG